MKWHSADLVSGLQRSRITDLLIYIHFGENIRLKLAHHLDRAMHLNVHLALSLCLVVVKIKQLFCHFEELCLLFFLKNSYEK